MVYNHRMRLVLLVLSVLGPSTSYAAETVSKAQPPFPFWDSEEPIVMHGNVDE